MLICDWSSDVCSSDLVDADRMLLALDMHPATGMHCAAEPCLFVRLNLCHVFLLPKIEQCEDEDPHQVDEMPVEANDLHGLVVRPPAGEEARTRANVVSPPEDRKRTRRNSSH